MERKQALNLVKEKIKNKNLVNHCLAVEAIMRKLAAELNSRAENSDLDEDKWAMVGLVHDIDYDLGALCFEFLGGYDFRKKTSKLPISASARVSTAPKVLSFRDTERYVEFNASVSFHINNNAAFFVGYRLIDFRFEDPVDTDWDDDAAFFGFRLSF